MIGEKIQIPANEKAWKLYKKLKKKINDYLVENVIVDEKGNRQNIQEAYFQVIPIICALMANYLIYFFKHDMPRESLRAMYNDIILMIDQIRDMFIKNQIEHNKTDETNDGQ